MKNEIDSSNNKSTIFHEPPIANSPQKCYSKIRLSKANKNSEDNIP